MSFVDDFSKWIKSVETDLRKSEDSSSLRLLGEYALKLIRDRTREGFGVKSAGAAPSRLKKLSTRYIERRRGMRLSPFTSPEKSNLTLTGAMLASLRVKTQKSSLTISPTGTDRKGVSNQDKANWQEDKGRIFLRLSREEMEKVREFYQKEILDKNIK